MSIRAKNTDKLVYRKDENGDYKITIKEARLSYEHVFAPWAKKPTEPKKYSGRFLLHEDTHAAEIESLNNFFIDLQREYFKGKIKASDLCFRNGDLEGKEEMENCWYIAASERETNPPKVIDRDKSSLKRSDDKVYSGAYVNVMIKPWKQSNDHGKKINANLLVVQYFKKGEKFGAATGATQQDIDEGFDEIDADDMGDDDGFE